MVSGGRAARRVPPTVVAAGCFLLLGSGVGTSTARSTQAIRPAVSPPSVEKKRAPEADADTLLVEVAGGADAAAVAADHRARRLRAIPGTRFVLVATNGRARSAAMRELRADPRVRRVEPNYVRVAAAAPTDPYYAKGRQGYLRSPRFESAWGAVPSASGVTVAVLDTGVDLDTPELAGRILSGWDVVNRDGDPSDDYGHGTEVAGVLAAAHDGQGIAGAAPGASILPVKVLDAQGRGTDADVATGITWAADHGARVINLSLGGPGDSQVLREAVAYALSKDAVVVASAGNDEGTTPNYPAAIPGAVAVAATDWEGDATFFTSYGDWVDVAAPGWDLWTTARASGPKASYASFSGTSASAPLVAGAAALVRAQNPGWTQKQVVDRILGTALDVGPRGRDPYHGAGLVDAYAAVGGPAQAAVAPPGGDSAEPNPTPDRATSLAMNAVVWSTSSPQGDTDWFTFTAFSTGEYLLLVQPDTYRDPRPQEFDPVVEIFDSTLRLVVRQDDGGIDAHESVLQSLAAGKYFVRVRNYAPSRSAGLYAVKIEPYGSGTPARFLPFEAWDLGSFPMSTAVGDATGDGRADVLVATAPYGGSPYDASLLVFPQIDDGWLDEPAQILPIGTGTQDTPALATGDLDGDGRVDAAVGTLAGVHLFKQAGGELAAWTTLDVPGVRDLVLADVTGDGRKDIVVQTDLDGASTSGDGIYIFAAPSWTRSVVEEGVPHGEFEVGDLNSDGRPDVAAIYETRYFASQRVDSYLQAADATWSSGPTLTSLYFPDGIAVGDVTGDGKDDVVTASWFSRGVALFAQGAGGFAAPVGFANNGAGAVTIADVNGDGRNDVVSGNFGTLGIHFQRGDGTLSPAEETGFGADTSVLPKGIAVGDFTGDGAPDVALAPWSYGWVTFLRQRTSSWPLPVWIKNTTPAEGGAAGSSVSIVLGRAPDATSVNASTVAVANATTGAAVPASVSYDAATRKITVQATLASGSAYVATINGVRDSLGNTLRDYTLRFTAGTPAADTTAPDTVIYDGPPSRMKYDSELRIHHYSTEAGTRFQCSMDSGTWNDCSDHYALGGPYGQGAHTFRVRAVDGAGNVDPTPASRSWTVDPNIVPPPNDSFSNPQQISGSSGSVSGTNVEAWYDNSATIASNVGGRSVWYRWTAPARARVTIDTVGSDFDTLLGVYIGTSPFSLTSIAEDDDSGGGRASRVTFDAVAGQEYMIAVDGYAYEINAATGRIAIQWSSSAADTTPPTVSLTSPADGAAVGGTVPLAASASDDAGVAKVEFLANGSVIETDLTSPYSATWSTSSLANGLHRLAARATDLSGNVAMSAERTVTVDNASPETTIDSGPAGTVASASASFGFSSSEPGSRFECSLDAAAFAACTSPRSFSGLADGQHTFRVRAIDLAGNVDATPASRMWTVDSTSTAATVLTPWTAYAVGGSPAAVATADVTGDGRSDVLVTTHRWSDGPYAGKLFLLAQQPDGSLASPAVLATDEQGGASSGPLQIATGDLNGDGRTDVAVSTNQGVDVWYQQAPGVLGPRTLLPATAASTIAIADVDRDGRNDIVVAMSSSVVLLRNTTAGFVAQTVGDPTRPFALADLNGDGRLDLVTMIWNGGVTGHSYSVAVRLQQGDGTFASPKSYLISTTVDPNELAAGDVNGDGRPDIVVTASANSPNAKIYVLAGAADGTLRTPVTYATYDMPGPVVLSDVNADGRTDVLLLHDGWQRAGVMLQQSGGTLGAEQLFFLPYSGYDPEALAVGELNGDGRLDLAIADQNVGLVIRRGSSLTPGPAARANDAFAQATTLSGGAGVTTGDLTGATPEAGERVPWGQQTVWYRWTAPTDGDTVFDTTDSSARTWLSVYTGTSVGSLTLVAEAGNGSTDAVATAGRARFHVSAGTTYAIQISNAWDVGPFQLGWIFDRWTSSLDTTPPTVRMTAPVETSPYQLVRGSFTFTAQATDDRGVAWVEFHFINGPVVRVTASPWSLTLDTTTLPDGSSWVYAVAADAAGNTQQSAGVDFVVDNTPPETTIESGPAASTTAADATLSFSSPDAGATFACSLDAAAFATCSSPKTHSGLPVGSHTFRVRGIDTAGNIDPTPATYTWTIEAPVSEPPETTITDGPPGSTGSTDASFSFSSSKPSSLFRCSLDGAVFAACTSPTTYSGLAVGSHTFRVEAIDSDGKADPTPASYTWTIEAPVTPPPAAIAPPETTITSGPPSSTKSTDAGFSFSSSVANSTFKCSLDTAGFSTCSSPTSYSDLAVGSHTFRVEAIDSTGNIDPTPATHTWTIAAQSTRVQGAKAAVHVRIVGRPIVGQRLAALVRSANGPLRYRWKACGRLHCSSIRGATRSSLRVRRAWLGERLRVTVIAVASGGRATATTSRIRMNR